MTPHSRACLVSDPSSSLCRLSLFLMLLLLSRNVIRPPHHRNDISVRFPITHGVPNPFGEATEIEQKIKLLEWKKQMLFSDIQREETLISNVKCVLKAKSDGYRKLFNDENLNKEFKKHFSKATSPRGI